MKPIRPVQVHDGSKRVSYPMKAGEWKELPAALDDKGDVLTEWELSAEDLARLWRGGTVRVWIRTGEWKGAIHPIALETSEPEP